MNTDTLEIPAKVTTEAEAEQFMRAVMGCETKDPARMNESIEATEFVAKLLASMPQHDADLVEATMHAMKQHPEAIASITSDTLGPFDEASRKNMENRATVFQIILETREKLRPLIICEDTPSPA